MNTRMVTLRDVAKKAGVSTWTCSVALNDLQGVQDGIKKRVREIADKLGYVPNPGAKIMNRKKTGMFGIILPVATPLFTALTQGLNAQSSVLKKPIFLSYSHDDPAVEARLLKMLSSLSMDGIIIAPAPESPNAPLIEEIVSRGTPVVQLERKLSGLSTPLIASQNQEAAAYAVKYLRGKGYDRIGLIQGKKHYSTRDEWQGGYLAGMQQFRPDPPPEWCLSLDATQPRVALETLKRFLMDPNMPRGLLWTIANETILSTSLKELGLENGRDLEVVLFDGDLAADLNGQVFVNLMQNGIEIGLRALQLCQEFALGQKLSFSEIRFPALRETFSGICSEPISLDHRVESSL